MSAPDVFLFPSFLVHVGVSLGVCGLVLMLLIRLLCHARTSFARRQNTGRAEYFLSKILLQTHGALPHEPIIP